MPTKVEAFADQLRSQILAGDFGRYGRLPSREELADQFKTSRDTINKVVSLLQAEGLLSPKGKRGVVVSSQRLRVQGIAAPFDLELKKQGLTAFEENVDGPGKVPASDELAQTMGMKEGTLVAWHYRKHGARHGNAITPYWLAENFYPLSLVDDTLLEQLRQDGRFDIIQAIKEKYAKITVRVHDDVISRFPTPSERELLGLKANAPVVEVRRSNFAEDDTVIMANRIIFVANFFTLGYDYAVGHFTGENTDSGHQLRVVNF
jgi:DNA-binding GntR family transcriptional regulator